MKYPSIILMFLTAISCFAQSKNDNSELVQDVNVSVELPTAVKDNGSLCDTQSDSLYKCHDFVDSSFFNLPSNTPIYPFGLNFLYIPYFRPLSTNQGEIYRGNYMALSATVDVTHYPGMMNKETGLIGASFGNGRANLYIGGIVNKYGFHGGLFRQLGVTGQFTYRISSPVSFTAFAYHYGNNAMPVMPNGNFMPPSMLGYYDVSRFGGYITYRTSEHFGVQMGGQVVERNSRQNHYEVEPIVTPYIKVGRGKKKIGIGLPVGQILYGIFSK